MNKPRISIIVAMADNRVIGNKGDIPWHIPGEQKRAKEITIGHPLIMGRKTHESIGRVLPGRLNIIVTTDKNYKVEGGVVVHSLDEAIKMATKAELERVAVIARNEMTKQSSQNEIATVAISDLAMTTSEPEIFIFGGANLYTQALPQVDRLYLTIVHKEVEGDAVFPDYSAFTKVIDQEEKEFEGLRYTYLTIERD